MIFNIRPMKLIHFSLIYPIRDKFSIEIVIDLVCISEAYSKLYQTSKIERFVKIVNVF